VLDVWMPEGERPTMSITVHAVPHDFDRDALLVSVVRELENHAPGIDDLLVATEVLSPADLLREYGSESIHHVERAIDQMVLLRPARPFARYGTSIDGLFLGSSGCHPGPGVTLAPGVLAARALLER
jgi:phytoene dehydrogenase-like protein